MSFGFKGLKDIGQGCMNFVFFTTRTSYVINDCHSFIDRTLFMILDVVLHWLWFTFVTHTASRPARSCLLHLKECTQANLYTVERKVKHSSVDDPSSM
jgi:hypothetical protein